METTTITTVEKINYPYIHIACCGSLSARFVLGYNSSSHSLIYVSSDVSQCPPSDTIMSYIR